MGLQLLQLAAFWASKFPLSSRLALRELGRFRSARKSRWRLSEWRKSSRGGRLSTAVPTNALPAMLSPTSSGWHVDFSMAAAPGPGPVWFNAEFDNCADAVDAIIDCFFGIRVDNYDRES